MPTHTRGGRSHRLAASVVTTLAVLAALLSPGLVPASAAAPPAPSGLSPVGTTTNDIPVLSWEFVPDATSYVVQVSASSSFAPLAWSTTTVNRQAVPSAQLPSGLLYWRVQARQGNEAGTWATASFTRNAVAGPALLSPSNSASLQQPDDPALLSWSPVAGVNQYTVQISTDEQFTDPARIITYDTRTTSYVVPNPQPATTYYWHVRGVLSAGIFTQWSNVRSYEMPGLPYAVADMPSGPLNQFGQVIFDGDLHVDWKPVAGATTYDVQISPDPNFTEAVTHTRTGIPSTRYSPPATLDNDQYFWRVRARDALGRVQDWQLDSVGKPVPTGAFERRWDDVIELEHPIDHGTPGTPGTSVPVSDPLFFQWKPIPLASSYDLQISPNAGFTPATSVRTCRTVHTTFTPGAAGAPLSCMPVAGSSYYWRVLGYDELGNEVPQTAEGSSEVGRFTYQPDRVQLNSPADATGVTVPVLRWEPLPRAAKYRVTISPVSAGASSQQTVTTAATSFTSRGLLNPGDYSWQVVPLTEDGRAGTSLFESDQRRFTVEAPPAATASAPDPTSPTGTEPFARFPTLRWTPVQGADRYRLWVRIADSGGTFSQVSGDFRYPAGEDLGTTWLSAGSYEWFVEALNGSSVMTRSASVGRFTIGEPGEVTGQRVALTGLAMRAGDTCATGADQGCQNLRQTPLLTWDAAPASGPVAGYWELSISRNDTLTNVVSTTKAYNNSLMLTSALADYTAGNGFYWHVRPCSAAGVCAAMPSRATHYFNKRSLPVDLLGPGVPVTSQSSTPAVAHEVTFRWRDYLETLTTHDAALESVQSPARTEARHYRVQVSSDPTFVTNVFDNLLVDQKSFTSFTTTYPEGVNYWRVRAVDGSQNDLEWSDTYKFVKRSGAPVPTSPSGSAAVNGSQPLRWAPMAYAASYDVEVYRSNDTQANSANLVLSGNSKQVAFSPALPFQAGADRYVWRVRRVDAAGRKGEWSATAGQPSTWTSFAVAGAPAALGTPGQGVAVPPSEALFTWQPAAGVASYRFERRRAGSQTLAEAVPTPALAWATTEKIADGAWEWRVVSVDAAGKDVAASPWASFTVAGTVAAVTGTTITGSGVAGTLLTATPPAWNLPGVVSSYQWLRSGSPIPGALDSVYVVQVEDVGRPISVKVTGSLPGYTTGTSQSNAITSTGGAVVATAGPTIGGTPAVGERLTAGAGTWLPASPNIAYQWHRDGVPIDRATGSTYTVQPVDAARALTVTVTASKASYDNGSATSGPVTVGRMSSTTTAALSAARAKPGKKVKVTVSVAVPSISQPTGSVKVYDGSRVIKTLTLSSSGNGSVSFAYKKLKKGKHTIKAVFAGNAGTTGSASRPVKLVVKR